MSAPAAELDPARLRAEKAELDPARAEQQAGHMERLQVLFVQAAANNPEVYAAVKAEGDAFFVALRRRMSVPRPRGGDTVSLEEYDLLETDFYAAIEREKGLKDRIDTAEEALAAAKRRGEEAERRVHSLTETALGLQRSLDEAAADAAAVPASPVAPPPAIFADGPPPGGGAGTARAVSAGRAAAVEEEVFAATMELQELLDTAEAGLAAVRAELAAVKAAAAAAAGAAGGPRELAALREERDAAVARADAAQSERRIALHIKEGALVECAHARNQLEKVRHELEAARAGAAAGGGGEPRVGHLRTVSEAEAHADEFVAKRAADLEAHSREVAELRAHIAGLEGRVASAETGRDSVDRARRALVDRNAALLTELQDTSAARDRLRDEAGGQQGESLAMVRRYEEQLERLRSGLALSESAPRMDDAAVREVVATVQMVYQTLTAELQRATEADEKQQVLCDLLLDYEGRLWHLQNEVKSIRTIVDIKIQDKEDEAEARAEEAMSRLEILRMQLREAKLSPQC